MIVRVAHSYFNNRKKQVLCDEYHIKRITMSQNTGGCIGLHHAGF
jgi:hypothetical protein